MYCLICGKFFRSIGEIKEFNGACSKCHPSYQGKKIMEVPANFCMICGKYLDVKTVCCLSYADHPNKKPPEKNEQTPAEKLPSKCLNSESLCVPGINPPGFCKDFGCDG